MSNLIVSGSVLAALLVALAAITALALESGGVAIVETRASDGSLRSTHVWYVEPDGELWLEAGAPENAWYQDAKHDPVLTLRADGKRGRYRAHPVDQPDAQARIRALLHKKYGWRDSWVGLLVDSSRSVAVRLDPEPP